MLGNAWRLYLLCWRVHQSSIDFLLLLPPLQISLHNLLLKILFLFLLILYLQSWQYTHKTKTCLLVSRCLPRCSSKFYKVHTGNISLCHFVCFTKVHHRFEVYLLFTKRLIHDVGFPLTAFRRQRNIRNHKKSQIPKNIKAYSKKSKWNEKVWQKLQCLSIYYVRKIGKNQFTSMEYPKIC